HKRRPRQRWLEGLASAALLALVALFLRAFGSPTWAPAPVRLASIAVAARDLEAGRRLEAGDLSVARMVSPDHAFPAADDRYLEKLVGLVLRHGILRQQPLRQEA